MFYKNRLNIEYLCKRTVIYTLIGSREQTSYSHKDTISNDGCVVPLRKECQKSERKFTTTQMSSQQVVKNLKNNENNYVTLLLLEIKRHNTQLVLCDKKEGAKSYQCMLLINDGVKRMKKGL